MRECRENPGGLPVDRHCVRRLCHGIRERPKTAVSSEYVKSVRIGILSQIFVTVLVHHEARARRPLRTTGRLLTTDHLVPCNRNQIVLSCDLALLPRHDELGAATEIPQFRPSRHCPFPPKHVLRHFCEVGRSLKTTQVAPRAQLDTPFAKSLPLLPCFFQTGRFLSS